MGRDHAKSATYHHVEASSHGLKTCREAPSLLFPVRIDGSPAPVGHIYSDIGTWIRHRPSVEDGIDRRPTCKAQETDGTG